MAIDSYSHYEIDNRKKFQENHRRATNHCRNHRIVEPDIKNTAAKRPDIVEAQRYATK